MKTNVSSTSLDAYHSLGVADYLQPKERLVLAAFKAGESLARKEISERTGLPINCVTGRCNSLVAKSMRWKPDGTKLAHPGHSAPTTKASLPSKSLLTSRAPNTKASRARQLATHPATTRSSRRRTRRLESLLPGTGRRRRNRT